MSMQSIAWQLMSEEEYAAFMEERIEWITPRIRKTFRYNADWSHLDEWEDAVWSYAIVNQSEQHDGDLEEGVRVIATIMTDNAVNKDEIEAAFRGELVKGCSCEHDCCGHYFGGLSNVTQLSRLEWRITAAYSRNY